MVVEALTRANHGSTSRAIAVETALCGGTHVANRSSLAVSGLSGDS